MAAPEVLKAIVSHGSDLTLYRGVAPDLLRQLATIAKRAGAKLTISTKISPALIEELSRDYGKTVAFIEGLDEIKKE